MHAHYYMGGWCWRVRAMFVEVILSDRRLSNWFTMAQVCQAGRISPCMHIIIWVDGLCHVRRGDIV
jgi:hypothetical protein